MYALLDRRSDAHYVERAKAIGEAEGGELPA